MKLMKCVHLSLHKKFTTISKRQASEFKNYRFFLGIQTRVADNDYYGHVNNSHYHVYADTILNTYLIWYGGLDIDRFKTPTLAYMKETKCIYRKPLFFPQVFLAGLSISKIGNSSVCYEVGFFEPKLNYNTDLPRENAKSPLKFDPLLKLGIGSQGLLVSENDPEFYSQLEDHYMKTANVISAPVHVFVDSKSHRPVKSLPNDFRKNIENLLSETNK